MTNDKKITKLKKLYDFDKPEDLFTIIPQEMEVAEVKKMAEVIDDKLEFVVEIIVGIAKENGIDKIDFTEELIRTFIKTIDLASKGEYGINKGK